MMQTKVVIITMTIYTREIERIAMAMIWPQYGHYTATIRPLHVHYTDTIRPLYRHDTATIQPSADRVRILVRFYWFFQGPSLSH